MRQGRLARQAGEGAIYKCRAEDNQQQLWYVILSLTGNQQAACSVPGYSIEDAICVKYYACCAHKLGEKRMFRADLMRSA